MAKKFSYPRTTISSRALPHSSVAPNAEDTTVLFMPLLTEKGPEYKITPVHSLSELTEIFGDLDYIYKENGQGALNTYNWLTNGGTVYVCRMLNTFIYDEDSKQKILFTLGNSKYGFKAKYRGDFYKNLKIEMNSTIKDHSLTHPEPIFDLTIKSMKNGKEVAIERFYRLTPENVKTALMNSEYIEWYTSSTVTDYTTVTIEAGTTLKNFEFMLSRYITYEYNIDADFDSDNAGKYCVVYDSINNNSVTGKVSRKWTVSNNVGSWANTDTTLALAFDFSKKTVKITKGTGDSATTETYNLTPISNSNILIPDESSPELDLDLAALLTLFYKKKYRPTNGTEIDLENANNKIAHGSEHAYALLNNHLETPIDVILDAGYPEDIKKAIWDFVKEDENSETENRPDIVFIADAYYHTAPEDLTTQPSKASEIDSYIKGTNAAIYEQFFTTNSVLDDGISVFVTPSYFLSRLIPYNDLQYGVQYPTAGLRRGVLSDATYINENPIPSKKQSWFESRLNYVEKTSREYSFQSQRTHDGSSEMNYTALSFLNNVRAFHLMQKELERLGRDYLFEFNDSVTLANLSNVLNRYMTQWVSNRTLSSAVVDVRKNPYSDEAVDITMSVRFTGTIEVISVDITIE